MKNTIDQGLKPRLTGEVASRHLGSARPLWISLKQGTLRACMAEGEMRTVKQTLLFVDSPSCATGVVAMIGG
jgi:hypothetical protein